MNYTGEPVTKARSFILALAIGAATAFSGAAPAFASSTPAARAASSLEEVTVTVGALNVRSGPTTDATILGRLEGGAKVSTNGKSDDGLWWKISYNGDPAYIYAEYATVGGSYVPDGTAAAPASGAVSVAVPALNVRAAPGLEGEVIGFLAGGTTLTPRGRSTDGAWFQIDYVGATGWIYAALTGAPGAAPAPAAAAPRPAAPAAAPGRFSGFELGGHINSTNFLPQMKDVGMSWVKYQVVMDGGAPDLGGLIGAIHGAGLKLLVGAIGNRARAADANYHKDFARMVASLAAQGADAIEVWNEPNLDREYGGSGNGQVNPENYANMLREAYGAIKSFNPNTLVISGAPAPTGYFGGRCENAGCDDAPFIQRLANTGAAAWMDCAGAHHNGTMVGPDQRSGAPVGSADHHQWYFFGTLDTVYNAFGGKVPVCWTELGYVTGEGIGPLPGGFSWGGGISLSNQADWLARAAELSRASGKVRMMIIWNIDFRQWNDDPQAGFSIFRPNGECRACGTLKRAMGR